MKDYYLRDSCHMFFMSPEDKPRKPRKNTASMKAMGILDNDLKKNFWVTRAMIRTG
jgi:hypothetical protein